MTLTPVATLVERLRAHGASITTDITTDGRQTRIRQWQGPIRADFRWELQVRRREVLEYLLAEPH